MVSQEAPKGVISSFRRKLESNVFSDLQNSCPPVFTEVTTFYKSIIDIRLKWCIVGLGFFL